jgi:hypothetical protein
MPHDFILQRITISIGTLSKYVREKKHKTKKIIICTGWYLHPVQMPPCHVGGGEAHLYRAEAPPHLYQMLCTGLIPGKNESYESVQIPVFPVVRSSFFLESHGIK